MKCFESSEVKEGEMFYYDQKGIKSLNVQKFTIF